MTPTTISIPQESEVQARVDQDGFVAVVGRHGKTNLMLNLARGVKGAILVRVPSGPDQVPYLLLQVAAAHGPEVLRDVADRLTRSVDLAIERLKVVVGSRPLLVDDIDAIGRRGIDPELRHALEMPIKSVRTFFEGRARVVSMTNEPRVIGQRTLVRLEPTVASDSKEMWERVGHNPDLFHVAFLREQFVAIDDDDDTAERSWEPDEIVADVWHALPELVQDVVALLAVHGRPIAKSDLEALAILDPLALEETIKQAVAIREGDTIWLPKPWYVNCPAVLRGGRSQAIHARLAQAFAGQVLGRDAHLVRPLFALEAHRHFAAVPDIERARQFAYFGAATLLDTARRLSLAGREEGRYYAEAAKAYDVVLQLEDQLTNIGGTLGNPIVGYAQHYKHFNRSKAALESTVETLEGYRNALAYWPENALFRSRMIVGLFLDDRYAEAGAEIADAFAHVPTHRKRTFVLRARSAEELLQHDCVEAALLVWHDYEAEPDWGTTCEQRLFDRLRKGFTTARLRSFGEQIVLFEPTVVRFSKSSDIWLAHALDTTGHGSFPAAAYESMISELRRDIRRLHRTLVHQLSAVERMRKQRLLGIVDLAASRLLDLGDGTTWVYGRLTEIHGTVKVLTDDDHCYELEPLMLSNTTAESGYRLARVRTGLAGEPVGPVIALDPPLGEDARVAFERWRSRIASDG